MSKIGKRPIEIPQGVELKIASGKFEAKGPKGTLVLDVQEAIDVKIEEKEVVISRKKETREASALWGLTRSLINNMITGVSQGFEKKLELQGVGYRMAVQGKKINLALGFSHPVEVEIPEGLKAEIVENNVLSISGIDKQQVGQFAANIRGLKPVEPYKGKGFRYAGEHVRRKVGKKAGTAK